MPFNTMLFVLFFCCFFIVFQFVARTRRDKLWCITLGSFLFYAAWDVRFVPLLFATAYIDFWVARAIARHQDPVRRSRLLLISIVGNLGVLGFFKYANFFASSAHGLLGLLGRAGSEHAPHLNILLPAGISFYTFQSMSYVIDVYRGELRARDHPLEFLSAVSFFPHLVAGPIIRASTLLPQFEAMRSPSSDEVRRAYLFIAVGVFNKTVADVLALSANRLFDDHGPHGPLSAWTGALAFSGQIYGDFSGYTDMAIGIALLLGFTLPANFNLPYIAVSPVDFWRRWHISLSTWLRDYLYIPLGGNRSHRRLNLFLTMLLGGLWHGASWTFVAWGAFHGALLIATHGLTDKLPRLARAVWLRPLSTALTFYLVTLGWVLFRADSFGAAWSVLRDMHLPSPMSTAPAGSLKALLLVFALVVTCHVASFLAHVELPRPWQRRVFVPLALSWLTFGIVLGGEGIAFIYFQF
ncbi:MAG: rane bound O-acyl transferase [Myxococcaceae bacterium]|nr:rane bound O-acyl transferase [Myxococcaceae bacterium]